jgi:hypothetical protein
VGRCDAPLDAVFVAGTTRGLSFRGNGSRIRSGLMKSLLEEVWRVEFASSRRQIAPAIEKVGYETGVRKSRAEKSDYCGKMAESTRIAQRGAIVTIG